MYAVLLRTVVGSRFLIAVTLQLVSQLGLLKPGRVPLISQIPEAVSWGQSISAVWPTKLSLL